MHVDQNWLKILGKLRKIMKLGKMFLIKLVSDYFSDNSRKIWQSTENLRKMILDQFREKMIFRKIFGKFSVKVRYISFLPFNKLFINRIARAVPWNTEPEVLKYGQSLRGPCVKNEGLVFHGMARAIPFYYIAKTKIFHTIHREFADNLIFKNYYSRN